MVPFPFLSNGTEVPPLAMKTIGLFKRFLNLLLLRHNCLSFSKYESRVFYFSTISSFSVTIGFSLEKGCALGFKLI